MTNEVVPTPITLYDPSYLLSSNVIWLQSITVESAVDMNPPLSTLQNKGCVGSGTISTKESVYFKVNEAVDVTPTVPTPEVENVVVLATETN